MEREHYTSYDTQYIQSTQDKIFTQDSQDYGYSEHTWTERLTYILQTVYPNRKEITAYQERAYSK